MCERFNLKSNLSLIAEYFSVVRGFMEPWSPRYNIAPTENVLCVRDSDQREFFYPKWGLIPSSRILIVSLPTRIPTVSPLVTWMIFPRSSTTGSSPRRNAGTSNRPWRPGPDV